MKIHDIQNEIVREVISEEQIDKKLGEIAKLIDCDFIGDDNFPVLGMNEIHVVTSGDIVFVDHPKYYDKALNSNATIILINKEVDCPDPISRIFFTLLSKKIIEKPLM